MQFFTLLTTTILAVTATVQASPFEKRANSEVVGNVNNPVDDVLTNINAGLEGFREAIGERDIKDSLASRSSSSTSTADIVTYLESVNDPAVDLAVNVFGGTDGFATFLEGLINDL